MAVVDKYVDSFIQGNKVVKLTSNLSQLNGESYCGQAYCAVDAADDDTSLYRLFKSVNPNLIPHQFLIYNEALTGGTSFDLVLCNPDLGPIISGGTAINLMSAQTMASGRVKGSGLSALSNIPVPRLNQKLFQLAGHTDQTKLEAYDIALRANTVGSASGIIVMEAIAFQG